MVMSEVYGDCEDYVGITFDQPLEDVLPCWIPQSIVSQRLFGHSGVAIVDAVFKHNGLPSLWATEFSNVHSTFDFEETPITIDGEEHMGTEQYFQLMKAFGTSSFAVAQNAMRHATPDEAFGIGRSVTLRSDWESVKVDVMRTALRAKFTQNPTLKQLLLSTGNSDLVHVVYSRPCGLLILTSLFDSHTGEHILVDIKPHDGFWGTGPHGDGRNMLGVLLMELRDELRKEL